MVTRFLFEPFLFFCIQTVDFLLDHFPLIQVLFIRLLQLQRLLVALVFRPLVGRILLFFQIVKGVDLPLNSGNRFILPLLPALDTIVDTVLLDFLLFLVPGFQGGNHCGAQIVKPLDLLLQGLFLFLPHLLFDLINPVLQVLPFVRA